MTLTCARERKASSGSGPPSGTLFAPDALGVADLEAAAPPPVHGDTGGRCEQAGQVQRRRRGV